MEDRLKKLEELIDLYKSNSITKEEYDLLKNELLIDNSKKVEIENNSAKPIIESNNIEKNQTQNNYQEKTFYESNKGFISIIVFVVIFILFIVNIKKQETVVDEPTSTTTYEQPIKIEPEPEQKKCYVCKGTGMVVCKMCNGTGTNDMGIDCSCELYNNSMIQMGRETSPYQGRVHKCIHCKGTGYVD